MRAAISAKSFWCSVSTGAGGGEFYALRAAISAKSFWFSVSTGAGGGEFLALRAAISAISFCYSVSTGGGDAAGIVPAGQTPGFFIQNISIFNLSIALGDVPEVDGNELSSYDY